MKKKKFCPAIEKAPLAEIRIFHEKKLRELIDYTAKHSNFYKRTFSKNNIRTAGIKSLDDLKHLPFTTKDDLQKHNNDFLCVPPAKVSDYMTTSGTLGEPVTFALTGKDLDRLAYNEAISFACAGAGRGSVFQLMTTLDRRFMAGLAYYLGLRMMGASVIRVGAGMPELHWESILRFKPQYIVAVPSFILKLIDFAEEHHIDHKKSSVSKAVCIGEPVRTAGLELNTLGSLIQKRWGIQLFSTYASTEMGTAFTECEYGLGGHHHPELIITEVLGEDDRQVKHGEAGEVVISTLGVQGMPLIRFRTGDICHYYDEPCPCGKTTIRLGPVIGRKQQMIKFRGTTLYPPALFNILDGFKEIENYVVEVSENDTGNDHIVIRIGQKPDSPQTEEKLIDHFRAKLRVVPEFIYQTPGEINRIQFPPSARKAIKFIDHRNLKTK